MTRFNWRSGAALVVALALLSACSNLAGMMQGFNARLAGGYSTVAFARDTAGSLLDAGAIEADEAENVQGQADHFRAALDLTREIHTRDPDTADAKLDATLAALAGLHDYLVKLQAGVPDDED